MSGYMKSLEYYKDYDLARFGEFYSLDWKALPPEKMKEAAECLSFCEGDGLDVLSYANVEEYNLWPYTEFFSFDGAERTFALEDLLKDAPHYLVMAHNCRWNGGSGYTIVDFLDEVLNRDYQVSIYPTAVSKGGKCLICTESSHDVPMGARTSIIALTQSEYEHLSNWCTSWDDVAKFAEKNEAKAKGGAA